jgi:hypothetical protein
LSALKSKQVVEKVEFSGLKDTNWRPVIEICRAAPKSMDSASTLKPTAFDGPAKKWKSRELPALLAVLLAIDERIRNDRERERGGR